MTSAAGARHLTGVYRVMIAAEISASAAYRPQQLLSLIGWVVPFAMLALWRTAGDGEPIEGFTTGAFTTYFAVILVTTTVSPIFAVVFGFGELVHDGRLSGLLLRPGHPLHVLVTRGLAESAVRVGPVVGLAAVTIVLLDGEITGEPLRWLVALTMFAIGIVGVVLIAALVATIAFWVTRSEALQGLIAGVEWLTGGLLVPVSLFPGVIPQLLRHQPFWLSVGGPGEVLAGTTELDVALVAAAAGVVWVGVLLVAFRLVWRRGVRRYEAVGT